jgi:hypothetical protein
MSNWFADALDREMEMKFRNYWDLKDKPCPQCGGKLEPTIENDWNELRVNGRLVCQSCGWKGGIYPMEGYPR